MVIHIGGDFIVDENDIVAVFDLDNTTTSDITAGFLKTFDKEGMVVTVSDGLPKSYIIVEKDDYNIIYLSPLSTSTILKRSKQMVNLKQIGGNIF